MRCWPTCGRASDERPPRGERRRTKAVLTEPRSRHFCPPARSAPAQWPVLTFRATIQRDRWSNSRVNDGGSHGDFRAHRRHHVARHHIERTGRSCATYARPRGGRYGSIAVAMLEGFTRRRRTHPSNGEINLAAALEIGWHRQPRFKVVCAARGLLARARPDYREPTDPRDGDGTRLRQPLGVQRDVPARTRRGAEQHPTTDIEAMIPDLYDVGLCGYDPQRFT